MEVTEVRIKLMEQTGDRLRAFCSVTFHDEFVVRDLKIIEGHNGYFVAMPSRKLTVHCPHCRTKNHIKANYCNHCGGAAPKSRVSNDSHTRNKLYADIAHPIRPSCREAIQKTVIEAFEQERQRAQQPNYRSNYDDPYDVDQSTGSDQSGVRIDSPQSGPSRSHLTRLPKDTVANHAPLDAAPQDGIDSSRQTFSDRGSSAEQDHHDPSFGDGLFE